MRPVLYVCIVASVIASPVSAQTRSGQEVVIADPSYEMTVTATRINQPAILSAGTVNILNSEDLDRLIPLHPAEALNTVAGVNIHQGSGQEHLTAIRSPVLTGGAGAGSFLYLEDGVPLRAAGFGNVNGLFEAGTEFSDRIEVVKGPGSVLYGSNAQHGLINFISQAPDSTGDIRLIISDDGQLSGRASWSGETDRLSLNLTHDNGFRDDSGFDQQKFQWRHDQEFNGGRISALTSVQNLNQETAGFLQEGAQAYKDDDLAQLNAFPEAYRDAWSARTQARIELDLNANMLALTPYARTSEIKFLRHFVPGQAREEQKHSSVGLLSTYYTPHALFGLDAEFTSGSLFEFQDNPDRFSFVQGLHYDYDVDAVVLSPYLQKELQFGADTTLTAGARLDYTRYAYSNNADVGTSGRFVRVADRTDEFVTFTPKIDLVHRFDLFTSAYVRAARGARAPQTSDLYSLQTNQTVGEVDPETLDMIEIGFKHALDSLELQASAFAMRKDNFFFRNANGFNVTNGQTEHIGIELSGAAKFTDWLTLSADLSLADHTYAFTDLVPSPSSSITDGDHVDSAPNTLANLSIVATPTEQLTLSLNVSHVGDYFTDPGNTRTYPGHEVFGARAAFAITEDLEIFLGVKNLFDTDYADRADFAFGNDRYFPGRPRHLLIGFTQDLDFSR